MENLNIQYKKLSLRATPLEKHMHDDAGIDLYCSEDIKIFKGETKCVKTDISMAIPSGYCGIIKDRSSIATKTSLQTVAGVIDAQYRGEIKIAIRNHGEEIAIKQGVKIAQMLILPVPKVELIEVEELDSTERGEKGFGSSDKQ